MTSFRETSLLRGVLAATLLLGIAGASRAQAPGSAFGQSPQQLQLHLERPAAPVLAAPNRGGLGLQKVPTLAVPNPKPKPAAPLNPSISPASVLKAVPDVRNLKTQVGEGNLRTAGFEPEFDIQKNQSTVVPRGIVVAESPGPGEKRPRGTKVKITSYSWEALSGNLYLTSADAEARRGFDLDLGQYKTMTEGADFVLRHYVYDKFNPNNNTSDPAPGTPAQSLPYKEAFFFEPSDGALLGPLTYQFYGAGVSEDWDGMRNACAAIAPAAHVVAYTFWDARHDGVYGEKAVMQSMCVRTSQGHVGAIRFDRLLRDGDVYTVKFFFILFHDPSGLVRQPVGAAALRHPIQ